MEFLILLRDLIYRIYIRRFIGRVNCLLELVRKLDFTIVEGLIFFRFKSKYISIIFVELEAGLG